MPELSESVDHWIDTGTTPSQSLIWQQTTVQNLRHSLPTVYDMLAIQAPALSEYCSTTVKTPCAVTHD